MTTLLEAIKSCQFEKLPEMFLSEYKNTKNELYGTPNFNECHISSSTMVAPEKGCIDLSKLNFGCLETNNHTCEWKIGDHIDELRERLCKHILNGDRDSFNQFVDTEVTNLEAVQQLLPKIVFLNPSMNCSTFNRW